MSEGNSSEERQKQLKQLRDQLAAGVGKAQISEERQKELLDRLAKDEQPFEDFRLDGTDVRWLIEWTSEQPGEKKTLNLSKARLENADLTVTNLTGANLLGAHLDGANLLRAYLDGANLLGAHLERAYVRGAHLEGANLAGAHLQGASLIGAHLGGKRLSDGRQLRATDLRKALLDVKTDLEGAMLGDIDYGFVSVADTAWNGVNLATIDWTPLLSKHAMLGDEQTAREENYSTSEPKMRQEQIGFYRAAVRAHRQLALALQAQGLNEPAAHFAYRAQTLQRKVQALQGKRADVLVSWVLDVVAGYGYKPQNCFLVYVALQGLFTGIYLGLGYLSAVPQPDFWRALADAFILSVTSFHGRAFLPQAVSTTIESGHYLIYGVVAAIEAVFGLVVEGIFVATLIQRFFRG
jgi:uncharacterized protein YjbI with pentapeptide repeats